MHVVYRWANDGMPRDAGIVIAVDVLRASTTLVSALEQGARRILVVDNIESARHLAAQQNAKLMGETGSKRIPGFEFGNSPAEIMQREVPERLVFTSSNFPRTLQGLGTDLEVIIGGLRNMTAAINYCLLAQRDRRGLIVIRLAGEEGAPCDEDLAFVLGIARRAAGLSWDSEQLSHVREQHQRRTLGSLVRESAHAQYLIAAGFARDVHIASQEDASDLVPSGCKLRGREGAFLFQMTRGSRPEQKTVL